MHIIQKKGESQKTEVGLTGVPFLTIRNHQNQFSNLRIAVYLKLRTKL